MPKKGYSRFLRFKNARELIQSEGISSVAMYEKWWQHNKPMRLPRRPDMIYKGKGWKSWNDFLGLQNQFKHKGKKKQYVSYEECKRFVRSRGYKNRTDFRQGYINDPNWPENIPKRPEYVYREWFSWKQFLGVEFKSAVQEALAVSPVLYVIKMPNMLSNVFKVNMTHGGKNALLDAAKQGAKIVAAFEYTDPQVNWSQRLKKYANNYWLGADDDYAFTNLQGFLFEISNLLNPVQW